MWSQTIRPSRTARPPSARAEALEPRTLLSAAPSAFAPRFANVNVSRQANVQDEPAVAVNKTNPSQLFALSNTDQGKAGLMAATSGDGGRTWKSTNLATGAGALPAACCDPSASFDAFGNLFIGYINLAGDTVEVAESTDAGHTFSLIASFRGDIDQPTVTTGPGGATAPGSVWVTYQSSNRVVARGAAVRGRGAVGKFSAEEIAPSSADCNFGDVAIGPRGQVMLTYQSPKSSATGRSAILASVNPDGLGPAGFGKAVKAASSAVGQFTSIPAQSSRQIDAEAGLAFDRSAGPFAGRAYLIYTDRGTDSSAPVSRGNTDVFLRYSDDTGAHWSNPIRLNDDAGGASQFFPRVAVDDRTGAFAANWYDTRDDNGPTRPADTDGASNTDVADYALLGKPAAGGVLLTANVRVSAGASNADAAGNSDQFGDYSGLDFYAGSAHPLWVDNSNSTHDNPDGRLGSYDIYTATLPAASLPAPSRFLSGGSPARHVTGA